MKPEQLITHFSALYSLGDQQPALFFAPGRVNLIGEHTDYNGGFVFPCAIQFGTWLVISPNGENILRFASLNKDYKAEVSLDQPFVKSGDHWVNYPLGVFDQFRKRGVQVTGFDLLFYGDIPDSAGLSSSASIEMVTAFALNDLLDNRL